MAKKILILLVALVVCIASYTAYALDITDDEDFSEVSTDSSFMLDSPLFTQPEDEVEYKQELGVSGFDKILENENFILYHNENRAYSIRVKNKETGFIWSSNGSGKSSDNVFIVKVLDEKNEFLPDILPTEEDYVNIVPTVDKNSHNVTE